MNDELRILVVEDEAHNSRMLCDLIAKLRPKWKVEAVLESVKESVEWLTENKPPELILMDIQLSDGICFSIFEKIERQITSRIIFTTAYDEYAIRAFKVNSIDYLLKPINEQELETAFQKFEDLRAENLPVDYSLSDDKDYYKNVIKSILEGKKEYRSRFLITGVSGFQKLETKDIAYIYSDNKITFAVDFNKKEHTLDYTLEQMESELNPDQFYRLNRKIIANIDAIVKVSNDEGGKLKVFTKPETNFEITVSRLKASEFKSWMGK
ncbi:MAG TPA: LytTR family DNA-binding domain-containing protein [Bacteroidales bacterium]|nr:LytTR family DNA-binding domain-containing protein [Bacteroidales bacterium]